MAKESKPLLLIKTVVSVMLVFLGLDLWLAIQGGQTLPWVVLALFLRQLPLWLLVGRFVKEWVGTQRGEFSWEQFVWGVLLTRRKLVCSGILFALSMVVFGILEGLQRTPTGYLGRLSHDLPLSLISLVITWGDHLMPRFRSRQDDGDAGGPQQAKTQSKWLVLVGALLLLCSSSFGISIGLLPARPLSIPIGSAAAAILADVVVILLALSFYRIAARISTAFTTRRFIILLVVVPSLGGLCGTLLSRYFVIHISWMALGAFAIFAVGVIATFWVQK